MTSRGKIKSKTVRATLANQDVLDMFQGIMGKSESPTALHILYPKYVRMRTHAERFVRLLTVLGDSDLMVGVFPELNGHLLAYVDTLGTQLAESFSAPDFGPYLPGGGAAPLVVDFAVAATYSGIPPEVSARFLVVFMKAKYCGLVNTAVVACNNLTTYKCSLADRDHLSDRFLRGAGMTMAPLPGLPQLNFKHLYIDDRLSAEDREFVLLVLHKLYVVGHDVYEAVSAPDVDVNEFIDIIMSSLKDVKKQIPRCNQAFTKIYESVDLLRNNFGNYYKDYVASSNTSIIMENFVLDVARSTDSSPTVTAQFRRIITHYRKIAGSQAANPKMRSLFQHIDSNFTELETDRAGHANEGDEESLDTATDDGAWTESEVITDITVFDGKSPIDLGGAPISAQEAKAKGTQKNMPKSAQKAVPCATPKPVPNGAPQPRKAKQVRHKKAGGVSETPPRASARAPAGESLSEELDRKPSTGSGD